MPSVPRATTPAGAALGLNAVLDADMPEGVDAVAADGEDVTAKVDERVADAVFSGDGDDLVDGIFLAEAAEVEAHAFAGQEDLAGLALHILPAGK